MAKYMFPAIFDSSENENEAFTITFPDLPGCISQGEDMEEAMYMARDVLEGFLYSMEEDQETIPTPSSPKDLTPSTEAFVVLVTAWTDIVRDEIEHKTIKKTVTIPKWINDEAEREGLNFSHTLNFAIRHRLGIREEKEEDKKKEKA